MNNENPTTPFEPLTETSTEIFDSVSFVPSAPSEPDDVKQLRSENDRLRSELRLITARSELTRLLSAEHARSPELLFEASRDRLAFDDDGRLTSTDELIAELKQRFPEQFIRNADAPVRMSAKHEDSATGSAPVPSINSGAGRSSSQPPLTKDQLARMKPREIARLDWNDVKQILSS